MQLEKDVDMLLNRGYKMEAIKMLRLHFSVDLMTALRIVEEWQAEKMGAGLPSIPIH